MALQGIDGSGRLWLWFTAAWSAIRRRLITLARELLPERSRHRCGRAGTDSAWSACSANCSRTVHYHQSGTVALHSHWLPVVSTVKRRPSKELLADLTVSAKIDFVTIATDGKRQLPPLRGTKRWAASANYKRLTIHDPHPSDVESLLALGDAPILEIEVAVDFRPKAHVPAGERDGLRRAVYVDLFGMGLIPENGVAMKNEFRAMYFLPAGGKGRTAPFNKLQTSSSVQLLYGGRGDDAQVKCYIKRRDQGADLAERGYVARVEVRLSGAALAQHGLTSLQNILGFAFRGQLMPYFRHARGVRRQAPPSRKRPGPLAPLLRQTRALHDQQAWEAAGAGQFVGQGDRVYETVQFQRDTATNDRVGQALTRLQRSFAKKTVCGMGLHAQLSL